MQTEYHTERRTVVTATRRPVGRPRKLVLVPPTPEPPKVPAGFKARFELIGDDPDFVLCDGLLPRNLANLIRAMIDA